MMVLGCWNVDNSKQLAINELQYFHLPFGLEYDITVPIEYEQELPNVLGDEPILADATLTFEEVDFEKRYCILKEISVINSDDTKRVVQELLWENENRSI